MSTTDQAIDMYAFTLVIEEPTGAIHVRPKDEGSEFPVVHDNQLLKGALADIDGTTRENDLKQNDGSSVTSQHSFEHFNTSPRLSSSTPRTYGVWDLLSCR